MEEEADLSLVLHQVVEVMEGLEVAEVRVDQLRLVKVLLAVQQAVLLVLVEEVLQRLAPMALLKLVLVVTVEQEL